MAKHYQGGLLPPIYQQSTIVFDTIGEMEGAKNNYGTDGTLTNTILAQQIAQLENASFCELFPSGLAAITLAVMALVKAGDHILVCDSAYGSTLRFLNFIKKMSVEVDLYPADCDGEELKKWLKPNTSAIFLESPSSLFFQIQDIEPIVELAQQNNITTVIDSTYSSGLSFKPLDWGIDVSVMALSKYCAGHSDVLIGSLSANNQAIIQKLHHARIAFGHHTSPQDCYLTLRGLPTLQTRLKAQNESTLEIAHYLDQQDAIDQLFFPPFFEKAQKQRYEKYFKTHNSLISFSFKEGIDNEAIEHFVNHLGHFQVGQSWGGFSSLVMLYRKKFAKPKGFKANHLVRLHIGLEEVGQLKDDLAKAFTTLKVSSSQ